MIMHGHEHGCRERNLEHMAQFFALVRSEFDVV